MKEVDGVGYTIITSAEGHKSCFHRNKSNRTNKCNWAMELGWETKREEKKKENVRSVTQQIKDRASIGTHTTIIRR